MKNERGSTMKKTISIILTIILIISVCSGCANNSANPPVSNVTEESVNEKDEVIRKNHNIRLAGGPANGTGYVACSSIGNVVNSVYPMYVFSPDITTGSAEDARMMASGDLQMGLVMADVSYSAYYGEREFLEIPALKESINYVMAGFVSSFTMFVPKKSDITSIADLEGKKVGVATGTMAQYYWPILVEAYGLDENKMQVSKLSLNDICTGINDGTLDFGIHATAKNANIEELAVTIGIKLINMEEDKIEAIKTEYPYFDKTILKAGEYTGINDDVITLGTQNTLCCRPDLEEQLIYDVCDAVFSNKDTLQLSGDTTAAFSLDNVLKGSTIPIHPGAERWYKEHGYL